MTDDCPGMELAPEDHRVLRQLSMRTKSASGLVRDGQVHQLAKALSMDVAAWEASVVELIHMQFLDRVDGSLYITIRCDCTGGDDPPEWLAKHLQSERKVYAPDDPWRRLKPSRRSTPETGTRHRPAPAGRDYPPRGGVGEATATVASSKQSVDGELVASAKSLQPVRVKARSVVSEPATVTARTSRELRMAFKKKWDDCGIVNKMQLSATHVLDPIEKGVFVKVLKTMRETEGLSADQILAMMDTFMAMVLSREISIEGKHVWRVFVANRAPILERTKRTRRFGSGEGVLHGRGQSDETLDRLRGRRVDRSSPSE